MPPVLDPRIDAYLAASAPFAQPILAHLRAVVHSACPDVEETIKWGFPHFLHRGTILCSMASFTAHCAFGFRRGAEVLGDAAVTGAVGQFGRIASITDLPPERELIALVQRVMARIEAVPAKTAHATTPRTPARPVPPVPDDFAAALSASPVALAMFAAFPPSHQREYLEWILDAKRAETRARRIAQAVVWIGEGKGRNWQYESSGASRERSGRRRG